MARIRGKGEFMAWTLDIHIIDVGAGDSSLIIANDPVGGNHTSMLIDGGLTSSARTVHNKVVASLPGPALNTMLVSHYDIDHSIGIAGLLLSDNLLALCDIIAQKTVQAIPGPGYVREDEVARMAARAAAAGMGATVVETNIYGTAAALAVPAGSTDVEAAEDGVWQLRREQPGDFAGVTLIPKAPSRNNAAKQAAYGAIASIAAGNALAAVRIATRSALFTALQTAIPTGARFETGGIYRNTRVIDIGNAAQPAQSYNLAVSGRVNFGGSQVQVPGIARPRTQIPALGSEVLWGAAGPPDANAPVAIVISTPMNWVGATTGTGWQGPNPPNGPVFFQGGTPGNCASIGIVLRFGNFTHYTAGDLPSTGEDPIGDRLMNRTFPNGHGAAFGVLPRIINLKCSHHGAALSSSNHFVGTVDPYSAAISCGLKHHHPTQRVIDTLNANAQIYWLTNCNYARLTVPFSTGGNQVNTPGNQAFVSGDNVTPNNTPGRNRGDIRFRILQANAVLGAHPRPYAVRYWEQLGGAGVPAGLRTVIWNF
jgi:beta-lactamase superfamily II metal-dependent hydrolase